MRFILLIIPLILLPSLSFVGVKQILGEWKIPNPIYITYL